MATTFTPASSISESFQPPAGAGKRTALER